MHTNTMHSLPKKVAKRKTDSPTQVKEMKVKKVDITVKGKKSSNKAELILQLEELHQKYAALEKEHHKNIDVIATLKESSVQIVKSSISCPKETQTENDISLKCM